MAAVRSPYNGSIVGEVPTLDRGAALERLHAAHGLFQDRGARIPIHERLAILRRFRGLLEAEVESLAELASREGGKPIADSLVEVRRAVNGADTAMAELMALGGAEVPMGLTAASSHHAAYTLVEP
jgi:acyl-CoA reductase-like NAD-dependent aldehyde dehydrogenase